jgi:hypothetical protein
VTIVLFVVTVLAWYTLRLLAHWWTPARHTVDRLSPYTLRLHAWVLTAPATFAYIAIFTASTLLQKTAPPHLIDLLTKLQSTNIRHLNLDPVIALADSALWVANKGSGLIFYIVLYGCVVAWAEPRYGTPRMVVIGVSGHVFGSLLTSLVERSAISSGRAPHRLALTTDVGVSYIMVAGCVAAVVLMRGRWRIAGVAALTIGIVVPLLVTHTLWNLGHFFATAVGLLVALVSLKVAPARTPVNLRPCLAQATAT